MALHLDLKIEGVCRGDWRGAAGEEIPDRYRKFLTQYSSDQDYVTSRNVDEGHATLVLFDTPIGEYESYAKRVSRGLGKITILCSMHEALRWNKNQYADIRYKLRAVRIVTVVGPTMAERPDIYPKICAFFRFLLG